MTPTHIQLRPATAADLAAILALERATEHAPHWPPATYAAILEIEAPDPTNPIPTKPKRCLFVAEAVTQITDPDETEPHTSIVGFAVGLVPPFTSSDDTVAELESVAVAISNRRTGIGRALCAAVLDWCREQGAIAIVLEVRTGSAAAIALYTELGFVPIGLRPLYYRDPEDDALILRLPLH